MCCGYARTQFFERSLARILLQLFSDQVIGPSDGSEKEIEKTPLSG